ncbi:hypothetical protein BPUTSESOX_2410 [uncultured Gammaproteobacteria bacterium]|nr:hypothetical protein [uncultured Gammaproteobacteria bacterium]CAC9500048.1 hypothetical protein [uncultured Gammaproteobacteria bacterium]CAC9657444.1 hypothetical protein [uncultured Gammaproteobacteria bacterium]CAC9958459.1 hypothetical protein [uncultured Gammaproteobacteria bacterium]VVH52311.1 hypothetical protein BPUTSESOX_2410 [uncultured Gammaproteobacteria bacterium]
MIVRTVLKHLSRCYLDLNEQQNKPYLNKGGLSTSEKPK